MTNEEAKELRYFDIINYHCEDWAGRKVKSRGYVKGVSEDGSYISASCAEYKDVWAPAFFFDFVCHMKDENSKIFKL
jgi:hypothetical protein